MKQGNSRLQAFFLHELLHNGSPVTTNEELCNDKTEDQSTTHHHWIARTHSRIFHLHFITCFFAFLF